ncbi:MAG: UvrD-helicase domain-containing protein, partial [Alphaproteobacteria bacterium]|nr:UvrD-helicase domain-containing protein [Alphaproteobacteria bacterium]
MQAVVHKNRDETENNNDTLLHLNPEQFEAVTTTEGPLLVLAGAGTGKTRVLTTRVAHILKEGLAQPWQILAVTFTNKAAGEMKHRIQHTLNHSIEGMWLGTFHALCIRILRRHCEVLGYETQFTIADTDDQLRLLKQIMNAEGIDIARYTPKLVNILINRWKDKALSPEQALKQDRSADRVVLHVYALYQERLKLLNVMDFGDLIMLTLHIFLAYPEVLKIYHEQFRYLLVDEYQDTNIAQYLWLRLLAQGTPNVCCVGDDDQSIYGWRGAEVGNILRFEQDFPGAKIIRLEKNYRSTTHILAAASALIAYNKDRLGKTLHSVMDDGEKITVKAAWNCDDEARYVGEEIEACHRAGTSLSELAVLVRAGFQTRKFEERLMTLGVPYRVIGGLRFYERAEVRDALAYFRLVFQPSDGLAFERIVNLPRRGIGQTSMNLFHQTARDEGVSLPKAARMLMETHLIKGQARTSLAEFFKNMDRWHGQINELKPSELASLILDDSGYVTMWRHDHGPDAPQRLENLKELIRAIDEFDTFQGFLEHVSLVMENTGTNQADMVNLMTLHGAKGL